MRLKDKFVALDRKISSRPLLLTFGVLIACTLLLILRKPESFTHAQFWAEDGVVWFRYAYNYGFWDTLLLPYSGTFSVFHRAIGSLATQLPLIYVPLFFSCVALVSQLVPVYLLTSSRLLSVVKYRTVGAIASVMYVLVTNSSEVFINLANIQWHFGVAAFLLLIASKPANRLWFICDIIFLALVGLTGPLTFSLTVIAFFVWLKTRERSAWWHLITLGATSLAQTISLLIIEPGQRGGDHYIAWGNAVKMVVGQIFTGSILGSRHVGYFYNHFFLYAALAAGLGIIAYAVIKGPSWVRYANLYALMLFISMLASLKPLAGVDVWGILTHPDTAQRYWYIPILVWLATLLWIVLAAKNGLLRGVCACLLILFVTIGVPNSWRIPPMPDQDYKRYVAEFNTKETGQFFAIPTNPDPWKIRLFKH